MNEYTRWTRIRKLKVRARKHRELGNIPLALACIEKAKKLHKGMEFVFR